jgi:hypothetical protein
MAKVTVTDRVVVPEERERRYVLELSEKEALGLASITGKLAYQPDHPHTLYDVFHQLSNKVGYHDWPTVIVGEPHKGSVKFADSAEEVGEDW